MIAALAAALLLPACASSGPELARFTPEELFAYGEEKLREEEWQDAVEAFERFTFEFPTHPRYQEARYNMSRAHYGGEEYISAATEYARLAMDFPAGPWADESRLGVCESYYRLSPPAQLDQQYSLAALEHCQSLVAYHPDSPFLARAQEIMAEMREKLAAKLFDAGAYYLRRRALESAIEYFQETVSRYPQSAHAPRALLRLVRIYEELQYDDDAETTRQRLLQEYPSSAEAQGLAKGVVAGQ
jgi:outer membrane protein assembly factor BamD